MCRSLWILVALLGACSSTSPSLMLVIDAEPGVRARTQRIELDVRGVEGGQIFAQTYDLSQRTLPIRKSFVPRGGDLSRFIVATVSAYETGSSSPLLVGRIRSGFSGGQNEVRVLLLDGCIGQPCTDGNTCVVESGSPRCVPTPEVVPVRDAGVTDAATSTDASRTDTTTCTPDCQGRNCGVDPRCGTSCGTCTAGRCNTERGVCEDVSCTPNCAGRICGADPTCGQSCGTCASGSCNANGQCEVACVPNCDGRTCGTESRCGTSCGTCDAPQVCGASGRCEAMVSNGPRFIDAPTIAEMQPITVGTVFSLNMTVTDPQGVDTIVQAEVRNPTGVAGTAGRYQTLMRRAGTGEYSAQIPWSVFTANNGGLPEDVSGTATRTLRIRFVDQDGNELIQDVSVRLGGCAEALCGGRCADCPANESGRICMGASCFATSCTAPYLACDGACRTCPAMATTTVCDGTICLASGCADGSHVCDGQCVSNANVNHCGPRCAPCEPPANAAATCNGSACDFLCNAGYHRCGDRCVSDVSTTGCRTCNAGYIDCDGECVPNRYVDADGDGYGTDTIGCAGTAVRSGDCNDDEPRAFPTNRGFYATPMAGGSFDFNCDGETTREDTLCLSVGAALCIGGCGGFGSCTQFAPCGGRGYTPGCYCVGATCSSCGSGAQNFAITQRCR